MTRPIIWPAALVLLLGGCTPSMEERVRQYNDDGVYLFQRGDYPHARDTFEAALTMAPADVGIRYNLAQCHDRLGDVKKAEQLYVECLQNDPGHAEGRFALAVLLVRQGRREEAVRMAEEWLTRQPRNGDAYALDGWLWHQYGDLPRAQGRLQQALQFDPGNARAMTELALVYESLRRPGRALVLYERCLEVKPNQPEVVDRVNQLRAQGVSYPKPDY